MILCQFCDINNPENNVTNAYRLLAMVKLESFVDPPIAIIPPSLDMSKALAFVSPYAPPITLGYS